MPTNPDAAEVSHSFRRHLPVAARGVGLAGCGSGAGRDAGQRSLRAAADVAVRLHAARQPPHLRRLGRRCVNRVLEL